MGDIISAQVEQVLSWIFKRNCLRANAEPTGSWNLVNTVYLSSQW